MQEWNADVTNVLITHFDNCGASGSHIKCLCGHL